MDDAVALGTRLLRLSMTRDGSSGGMIRLVVISEREDGGGGVDVEERAIYPSGEGRSHRQQASTDGVAGIGTRGGSPETLIGFASPIFEARGNAR